MMEYYLQNSMREAITALLGITEKTEKFVEEKIYCVDPFGYYGWKDICAKKIGSHLVDTVKSAVNDILKLYEIQFELEKLILNIGSVFGAMAEAKKELE